MYTDAKLISRPNFVGIFDCVYLGSWSAILLCPNLEKLLTPSALTILETPKYFANLNQEQKKAFLEKIKKRGNELKHQSKRL